MASLKMKRWPPTGTRVHCEWLDICAFVNSPKSTAEPAACWSEGILVKKTKSYIVLASSQYRGEGDDPVGDYTAIPIGVVTKVKRL